MTSLLTTLMLVACNNEGTKPEDIAGEAARQYYLQLIEGKYEQYISGIYGADSLPKAYRSQLVDNAKMFLRGQKGEHDGALKGVELVRCTLGKDSLTADAFLTLCYADSTREEVVVGMVKHNDIWYLK